MSDATIKLISVANIFLKRALIVEPRRALIFTQPGTLGTKYSPDSVRAGLLKRKMVDLWTS